MTRLPAIEVALIDDAKLTDYLFNHAHPSGGPKARFLERFGFAGERLEELRRALLLQAQGNAISASRKTDFGTIFEIEGALPSPDGRNPFVRTVWMIDDDATAPRLITMVPMRRPRKRR